MLNESPVNTPRTINHKQYGQDVTPGRIWNWFRDEKVNSNTDISQPQEDSEYLLESFGIWQASLLL